MNGTRILIIMMTVTFVRAAKDVLAAIRCRKRAEELGFSQQVWLVLDVLMVIILIVLLVN